MRTTFYILILLLSVAAVCSGQQSKPLLASLLYEDQGKFWQEISFTRDSGGRIQVFTECFFTRAAGDSVNIFSYSGSEPCKAGPQRLRLYFGPEGRGYIQPGFAMAMKRSGVAPAGRYSVHLSLVAGADTLCSRKIFTYERDSILNRSSVLARDIDNELQDLSRKRYSAEKIREGADRVAQVLDRSSRSLEKYFRKKGLQSVRRDAAGRQSLDIYSEDWFIGRYQLNDRLPLTAQLKAQAARLDDDPGAYALSGLGDYTSLQAQFREMSKESRDNKELAGEISLSGYTSNSPDPGSVQDRRYYELRGMLSFPLLDIPFNLDGFYTSQDRNRQAKAGYLHFSYDAEKAKEQLMKLVGSYNNRYRQALAGGQSYELVYGTYTAALEQQKRQMEDSLKRQLAIPGVDISSFSEAAMEQLLQEKASAAAAKLGDTLAGAAYGSDAAGTGRELAAQGMAARKKGEETYTAMMERYRKIRSLEERIRSYRQMLEQYRSNNYYDSLSAYGKLKDLDYSDQESYRTIARKASGILPEGKAKSALNGLTSFDAGIFPKYVSGYTLSGQTLKGLDIGYDLGAAEVGLSYGRTEFISRSGEVEQYKAYGFRARSRPLMGQRFGFVYYGYTPSGKLSGGDGFFRDVSVSLPSFRNPVHIISGTYSGQIVRTIQLEGEYAVSVKQGQSEEAARQLHTSDRSAYNIKGTGTFLSGMLDLEAGYEHAGRAFENNTLPVTMAGTDRVLLKAQASLFGSFLKAGAEYHHLTQHNFASVAGNTRWGFHIATRSKRFPSFALSYKPFATFRSFDDTLNIQQKPLIGDVWTGKASYQFKRQGRVFRFSLVYNRNNSIMDTVNYSSTLWQFNTIYSFKALMLSFNLGGSDIRTDYLVTAWPAFHKSQFAGLAASGAAGSRLQLNGGLDLARTDMGISRYGLSAGLGYGFVRLPLRLRLNGRYARYLPGEGADWQTLCGGGIELSWRFTCKLFDQ